MATAKPVFDPPPSWLNVLLIYFYKNIILYINNNIPRMEFAQTIKADPDAIVVGYDRIHLINHNILQICIKVMGQNGLIESGHLWDSFWQLNSAQYLLRMLSTIYPNYQNERINSDNQRFGDGWNGLVQAIVRIINKSRSISEVTYATLYDVVTENIQRIASILKPYVESMHVSDMGDWAEDEREACMSRVIFDKDSDDCQIRFDSIIGQDEAKSLLMQTFVQPLKYPNLFGKPGKGVILHGPPGTGKTMLAKACINALADENRIENTMETCMDYIFFAPSADTLKGKYVGENEKKIKNLFVGASKIACKISAKSKKACMAIIFLDEVDNIAGSREGAGDSSTIVASSVNPLLQALDGIKSQKNVAVIAATNLLSRLDLAFTRRFDYKILVTLPTEDDIYKQLNLLLTYHVTNFIHGSDRYKQFMFSGPACKQVGMGTGRDCYNVGLCDAKNVDILGWQSAFNGVPYRCINSLVSDEFLRNIAKQCAARFYSQSDIANMFAAVVRSAGQTALTNGRFITVPINEKNYFVSDIVPISAFIEKKEKQEEEEEQKKQISSSLHSRLINYNATMPIPIESVSFGGIKYLQKDPNVATQDMRVVKLWSSDDILSYTTSGGKTTNLNEQHILLQYNVDVTIKGHNATFQESVVVFLQLLPLKVKQGIPLNEGWTAFLFRKIRDVTQALGSGKTADERDMPIEDVDNIYDQYLSEKDVGKLNEYFHSSLWNDTAPWDDNIYRLVMRVIILRHSKADDKRDDLVYEIPIPTAENEFHGLKRKITIGLPTALPEAFKQKDMMTIGEKDWNKDDLMSATTAMIAEHIFSTTIETLNVLQKPDDPDDLESYKVNNFSYTDYPDGDEKKAILREYQGSGPTNDCADIARNNGQYVCWNISKEDFRRATVRVQPTIKDAAEKKRYDDDK
jgi:DNA polymerase III delta prime subunit